MTAKEKLESVRMYGRRVSEFLLPDQMKFIETAMEEYAEQQLKILNIPDVIGCAAKENICKRGLIKDGYCRNKRIGRVNCDDCYYP